MNDHLAIAVPLHDLHLEIQLVQAFSEPLLLRLHTILHVVKAATKLEQGETHRKHAEESVKSFAFNPKQGRQAITKTCIDLPEATSERAEHLCVVYEKGNDWSTCRSSSYLQIQQGVDGTFGSWELRCSLSEFTWKPLQSPNFQLRCVVDVCLAHLQVWVPIAVVTCFFCLDGDLQLLAAGRPHLRFRSCTCVFVRQSLKYKYLV